MPRQKQTLTRSVVLHDCFTCGMPTCGMPIAISGGQLQNS